ncbi:MAG: hypothetical protein SAMD01599839_17060 [Rectinema sp.]
MTSKDVTKEFRSGPEIVLAIAQEYGCRETIWNTEIIHMDAEMTSHRGYEKNDQAEKETTNR